MGRGSFGTEKLRGELGAEDDGARIPTASRWLGRMTDVKARYSEGETEASSVTFPVLREATFSRLQKRRLQLLVADTASRPSRRRGQTRCAASAAGGATSRPVAPGMPAAPSAQRSITRIVTAGKGRACAHVKAKCLNSRGPHFRHANACPEAKQAAKWYGRDRRRHHHAGGGMLRQPPLTSPPPEDAAFEMEEMEVEGRASAPEEAMEE